jgi:hypothetical protein
MGNRVGLNAPLGGACTVLATDLSDGKSRWPARLPTMHRWPVRTGGQCNDLGGKTAALRPTQPVDFSERIVFLTRRQFELPPRAWRHAQFGQHQPQGVDPWSGEYFGSAAVFGQQRRGHADEGGIAARRRAPSASIRPVLRRSAALRRTDPAGLLAGQRGAGVS